MSDSTKKTTRLFRPAGIAIGAAAVAMVAIPLTFASAEMRPGPDGERFAASQGEHGGHHMRGHQGRGGHHMARPARRRWQAPREDVRASRPER